jgi:hypothetical protein
MPDSGMLDQFEPQAMKTVKMIFNNNSIQSISRSEYPEMLLGTEK